VLKMAQANPLALQEADVKMMLAAEAHKGTRNLDAQMSRYVWRRRQDGIYLLNLGKTWEKLTLAARIIVAIENPKDVILVSARPWGQRAVFKFAQYTGASYIGGRYTPGTFTNQYSKKFLEPRLLIVTDPRTDHQPILEASYVNIPVIAFADTDCPLVHVDVAIPCNNKGKHSVALMYWLLAREVLRMKAQIARGSPWSVMVDLFMQREEEVAKEEDKPAVAAIEEAGAGFGGSEEVAGGNWGGATDDGGFGNTAAVADAGWNNQPAVPAADAGGWNATTDAPAQWGDQ
jgi:small subunit ribosomal protein SAe